MDPVFVQANTGKNVRAAKIIAATKQNAAAAKGRTDKAPKMKNVRKHLKIWCVPCNFSTNRHSAAYAISLKWLLSSFFPYRPSLPLLRLLPGFMPIFNCTMMHFLLKISNLIHLVLCPSFYGRWMWRRQKAAHNSVAKLIGEAAKSFFPREVCWSSQID